MKSHELYTILGEIEDEYILDACPKNIEKEKNNMKRTINKKIIYRALAIAACFAMLVTGAVGYFTKPADQKKIVTTVTLDVNPSLAIALDDKETVLDVVALNEDAEIVIGTMDFAGSNLDVTIHALVGSMITKGYLTDIRNSVLVSVESESNTIALREKLTAEISALIGEDTLGGSVIMQTVTTDEELKNLAEKHNISVGKAQLINTVLTVKADLTFDELVPASITELYLALGEEYFAENNECIDVEAEGTVVNKNYCGVEHAVKEALEHYGYNEDEITQLKTELGVVNGLICYTVVFRVETEAYFKNYQVRVNAVTGQYQAGGYSGGAYGGNKVPTDDVPEGHLTPTEAIELACKRAGVDKENVKVKIVLGHIDYEYAWGVDIESETTIYTMDIYSKTGEIVNYEEKAK